MELEFAEEAQAEVNAATLRYWEIDPQVQVARRFLAAFNRALARLVEAPEGWPALGRGVRRVLLHRYPYAVIYQLLPDRVVILAVTHQHQKPGYWRKRMRPIKP